MLVMHADPEVARDIYEAEHGPIMEWTYGVGDGEPAGEAASFFDALTGLMYEVGDSADAADSDAAMATWEVFDAEVREQARNLAFRDLKLTGPDGRSYWIASIDR